MEQGANNKGNAANQFDLAETVKRLDKSSTELKCNADFHFEDSLIKLPLETKDGHLVEAAFCYGYGELKYLAALSTQIGCPVRCKFCEISEHGFERDLTPKEMLEEAIIAINTAVKRGYDVNSKPTKFSFVMGGETLLNEYFSDGVALIKENLPLQLKISSVAPDHKKAEKVYKDLINVVKDYPNIVQFQISLHSTDEVHRQTLARAPLAGFKKIREMGEIWYNEAQSPRKVDLSFTVNEKTPMNPKAIKDVLSPDLFAIRLRGYVPTFAGNKQGFAIPEFKWIKELEQRFNDLGYQIIPGMAGLVETDFKLAPGEILEVYKSMKHDRLNKIMEGQI